MTRGRAARSNDTAPLVVHLCLVSGSGSSPLNTWAVSIDLIDPIDRRLKVGVLYPLRPRETQEPTQPAEAVLHHHDFSAAASAGLRANTPGGGRRHGHTLPRIKCGAPISPISHGPVFGSRSAMSACAVARGQGLVAP